jgi:hypothetical protein
MDAKEPRTKPDLRLVVPREDRGEDLARRQADAAWRLSQLEAEHLAEVERLLDQLQEG